MALVMTKKSPNPDTIVGNKRKRHRTVAWGVSYPTGGEAFTAASFGLHVVEDLELRPDLGYTFKVDYTNSKIKAYAVGQSGTVTVNPGNHTAVASVNTDVTVTGLATTDTVIVVPPVTLEAGIAVQGAFVTAPDTLRIRTTNASAGALDPASATWTWVVTNRKEVMNAVDLSALTAVDAVASGW